MTMNPDQQSLEQLLNENQNLQLRLSEAEQTLAAIQNGEVDALIVSHPDGNKVFILITADHSYRVMVEAMYEGAAFIVSSGHIYYCNQQLATLLQIPLEKLMGSLFIDYVSTPDKALITERLKNLTVPQTHHDEITLITSKQQALTVLLSWSNIELTDGLGLIITDISDRKYAEQQIKRLNRLYEVANAMAMATIHTKDRNELFQAFCQIAVTQGKFRMAWVGLVNPNTGIIDISSTAGESHYLEGLHLNIHTNSDAKLPTAVAIRTGNYCLYNDFLGAAETLRLHEKARHYGLLSSASIAIKENGIIIGALSLYAGEKNYFDEQQISLLKQMGADISFAIDNINQQARLNAANLALLQAKERESAAELLNEKERLLSESQSISHIGSWSYDFNNPIIWSDETYHLLSVSADSFIPTPDSFIDLVHVDDRLAMRDYIAAFAEGDNPGKIMYRRILPDGTVYDVTEQHLNEVAMLHSKERLRLALDAAKLGIFDRNILNNQVTISERTEEIWGYAAGEFKGHFEEFASRVHPEDLAKIDTEMKRSLTDQDQYNSEYRVIWPDQSVHWLSVIGEFYMDTTDYSPHIRGIIEDITPRKLTENSLKLAASVFTHSREGIMITDAAAHIIDVNDAFSYITGYSRAEVIGCDPSLFKSKRNEADLFKKMWRALITKKHWYGELWNHRKNGDEYAIMLNVSAVLDNLGKTQSYVALFSDITATKTHQQQLEHIANYDALTGLPNRLLLADRLEQAIIQAQRQGDSVAIVYLDLDGFKAINDQHGHSIGDELLITVSQRMRDMLREVDTLARIGGDEFVAVLVNLYDQEDCEPLLKRLLRAAADPLLINDLILQVSASIGVTLYPKDDSDADQLLRHADQAMYAAKQSGKNRYLYFDLIRDAAIKIEQESLANIRNALDKGEFILFYQPKVNLKTGQVIGAEALIRWQHPELGLLLPANFLPSIKNHPYDIELGEWVIDKVFTQLSEWQQQDFTLPISVNIGAQHLQQNYFVLGLSERFKAHPKIRPHQIELEILESSALEDIINASNIMKTSCDIGVHFALDDFGTGYSSLTYLRHLPVNMLKIDQSFVRDMLTNLEDLSIIEGVIGLARAFHHQVIAEGVETTEHCDRLLELGCDLAQGFAIAKPMPAEQLPDWVKDWHQQSGSLVGG